MCNVHSNVSLSLLQILVRVIWVYPRLHRVVQSESFSLKYSIYTYTCMRATAGYTCNARGVCALQIAKPFVIQLLILYCTWLYSALHSTTITLCMHLAAATCVSCQELTSTLREGNRTCPGDEVIFNCTVRAPSTLPVLVLAWSSTEYIGQGGSLQFSTADMLGAVETSVMDGNVTATATLTNYTNVSGELVLESTLCITAVVASTVTCSGSNGVPASIGFTISGTCAQ